MRDIYSVATAVLLALALVLAGPAVGTAAAVDDFEPNDTFDDATSLTPGSPVSADIEEGDIDVFVVTVDANDTISAQITLDNAVGDLDVALFGPDREILDVNVSSEDVERIDYVTNQSGPHYVVVLSLVNETGPYELLVDVDSGTGDGEPREDDAEEGDSEDGDAGEGDDGRERPDDDESGDDGRELPDDDESGDDADDESGDDADDESGDDADDESGDDADDESGDDADDESGDGIDANEPNDDISQATPLAPGETVDGIVTPDDFDVFVVDLSVGAVVFVQMTSDASVGNLEVVVFSPDVEIVGFTTGEADVEQVGFVAETTGSYYVVVLGSQADDTGEYELVVSV